ncbi:MAG: hypothetical protein FWC83_02605 [Alphaproteobacteria bacterium]|nr:hypothetical protein [Alphaproteobacteria bacterium]
MEKIVAVCDDFIFAEQQSVSAKIVIPENAKHLSGTWKEKTQSKLNPAFRRDSVCNSFSLPDPG